MKFIKNLALVLVIFAFIGCASTELTSTAPEDTIEDAVDDQAEVQTSKKTSTLIDRYISGEIPGYKD
ncbi:MAG: hypothetical protein ACJAT5_000773 [Lentimonas sp.]|jgi:hypothetical protein